MAKEKPYKVTLTFDRGSPCLSVSKTMGYHRTYDSWPPSYFLSKLVNLWNSNLAGEQQFVDELVVDKFRLLVEEHYGHLVQEVVRGTTK